MYLQIFLPGSSTRSGKSIWFFSCLPLFRESPKCVSAMLPCSIIVVSPWRATITTTATTSRFMEPLLSEILQTFKTISPPESSPKDNDELVRAKRKLKAAGLELSPPVKRRTSELSESASSARQSEHPLPVEQSPAEAILNKAVEQKPASYSSANTKAAMDAWLKSHQSQFRGQTVKFKKHVAQVTEIISSSGLAKSEIIDSAVRYGLNLKLAGRLSVTNLATFIAACQYEAS